MKDICFFLLVFTLFQGASGRLNAQATTDELKDVYDYTREVQGIHPQLKNGIYYEDLYYNAEGHPYIFEDSYYPGSVRFKNQLYEGLMLNYDIFDQRIILLHDKDAEKIQNYLAVEFISDFEINGLSFRKLTSNEGVEGFYQVVAESEKLLCCYSWYKSRSESLDGEYKKFVFSESKYRRYLVIDNDFHRYRNNRSFLQLFPKEQKDQIREYLRSRDIKVNKSDPEEINGLIQHCTRVMVENPGDNKALY